MKCLTHNLEVNYPCSPACPLFGDCVVAFQNEQKKWVQTNADRIRAMSDKELAGFIEELAYNREPPWGDLFQETFCKGCPAQEYTMENGQKMRLRECDFADGECPHGSDIAWWLQQPAEEGDRYAAD